MLINGELLIQRVHRFWRFHNEVLCRGGSDFTDADMQNANKTQRAFSSVLGLFPLLAVLFD